MANSLDMITSNKSFSGADMVATCQININGENHIYTLGSIQTITYSIHLDRKPIKAIGNINAKDYVMGARTIAGSLVFAVFNKHFAYEIINEVKDDLQPSHAFLVDELPPFNVTISFANEYGQKARLVIYGIRLVNEGQVMSVNDIYTENTYQFVATDLEYLNDIDGYSSEFNLKKNANIIGSKSEFSVIKSKTKNVSWTLSKPIVDNLKDIVDTIVTLRIFDISPAIKNKKGVTMFSLNPWQSTGKLTISGPTLKSDIVIDVAQYKNQNIYVELPAGKYYAVYNDTESTKHSEKKPFIVISNDVPVSVLGTAPLIEYCTNNCISVYSNEKTHTKVKYAEVSETGQLTYYSLDLVARKCIIVGLKENTKYLIYTTDGINESARIYAKTNEFNDEPFEILKRFCIYNQDKLSYGYLSDYIAAIEIAKTIASNSLSYMSLSAAMMSYKQSLYDRLCTISSSQYSTYEQYMDAVRDLKKKSDITMHLITICNKLANDGIIAINQTELAVQPVVPEMIDAVNCVFIFDNDVEKLEFYRENGPFSQLVKTATKNNFYVYSTLKQAYKFVGTPGRQHHVYAYNKYGKKSPILHFYVMTNEEKAKALDSNYVEKTAVNAKISKAEKQIGQKLNELRLSKVNRDRLLIQEIKVADTNLLPAPVVTSKTDYSITLDVNYEELLKNCPTVFYACIADINNALYNTYRYKIIITNQTEVTFTTANGGVKPNSTYAIWIENESGVSVSNSVTVSTAADTDDEEAIALYEVEKILSRVEASIKSRITITDDIAYCIDNLKNDTSVTWKNVFDKIANNIIQSELKVISISKMIEAVYKAKMDLLYSVDTLFSSPYYDKDTFSLTFPVRGIDYRLSALYIGTDGVRKVTYSTTVNQENTIKLDTGYKFIALYAINADVNTKSGLIFIDTLTKTATGYKINMRG